MNIHTPRLSLGMPVYNGENFIAETIESIRAQSFTDFELVISDNASNDRTPEICKEYTARDPRIRYHRNDMNIGLIKNFNRAFELSSPSSEYFKFAPHDDLYDPQYLEKCIAILDQDPTVILSNTKISIVNENGEVIKHNEFELKADQPEPHQRFLALLNNSKCFDLFAVIRRKALTMMPQPVYHSYGHSDGVLLARLGLLGRFYYIEEHLFFNRDYKERSGNKYKTYREYTYFIDPAMRGKIIFPRWRMLREFLRSIMLFPLDRYQRIRCYGHMIRWVGWYWKSLTANILIGVYELFRLPFVKLSGKPPG